jgi:hypothetical protein
LDLTARLGALLGGTPSDVRDAANDLALPPSARTSYGDLLLDMQPGEERYFEPLGGVGPTAGRFLSLSEGGDRPAAGEVREWADRETEALVAAAGQGRGFSVLGDRRPRLFIGRSPDALKSRFDPFPVVSDAFRAVIQRLDPEGAVFHPVDLHLADGRRAPGEWRLFDVVRTRQVVDLSRFRGAIAHVRGGLRLVSRAYAFEMRTDIPASEHVLRDPLLSNVELISREALAALAAAGVADVLAAPVDSGAF